MLIRRDRILSRQCAHPLQRLETDRTNHDQLSRHRFEQQFHLADQCRQLGLDPGRGNQFFQGLQPGAALAAERDSVRLAGSQTINQSMRPVRAIPVAVSGHPVMLVDRHVSYLPVCVFTYQFSLSGQHGCAGLVRFGIESQPEIG